MTHVVLRYQLNAATGVSKDAVVLTWHFNVTDLVVAPPLIATAIDNFFDQVGEAPATIKVSNYLATAVTGVAALKFYDMSQAQPRVPFYTAAGALTMPGGVSLPSQLAICASYKAAPVTGEYPRRRRGRLYIGPFTTGALAGAATEARPHASLMNGLVGAMKALKTASAAAATWDWCGYSRVDNVLWNVASGWVDNRFDVMRSRVALATARTVW